MAEKRRTQRSLITEILKNARYRAKVQGIPCTIQRDDIAIPATCPVLGVELQPTRGRRGKRERSPSLDRIDAREGYVPGNVHVISMRANRIKNDATPAELRRVADWLENREIERLL